MTGIVVVTVVRVSDCSGELMVLVVVLCGYY